ncbi:hypothetical protein V8E54_015014 [Elaphomyces granulatus]
MGMEATPVEQLERDWGAQWRPDARMRQWLSRRKVVWDRLREIVDAGQTPDAAVDQLRKGKSLHQLGKQLKQPSSLKNPPTFLNGLPSLKRHLYCILLPCNGSYHIDVDTGLQIENDRWGPEWVELDLDTQPMIRLAPPPEREYPDLKTAKDSVQQRAMEHRYAVHNQRSKTRKSGGVYKVFLQCDRAARYLDRCLHSADHLLSPHQKRWRTGTRKTNCPL